MATRFLTSLTALLLAALSQSAGAGSPWKNELAPGAILKPDQAFQLMPVESHGKTLRVEWAIAPGYYLYLSRLKFESPEPAITFSAAKLPIGEKHHDEHFGDVVIQRAGRLVAEIPASAVPKTLKLTYQGCAEIGVCLPPQYRSVTVFPVP